MSDIPPSDVINLYPKKQVDSDLQARQHRLSELDSEHRDLDEVISRLNEGGISDQLRIQRLKKRKLNLKDEITRLRAKLLPDIIA